MIIPFRNPQQIIACRPRRKTRHSKPTRPPILARPIRRRHHVPDAFAPRAAVHRHVRLNANVAGECDAREERSAEALGRGVAAAAIRRSERERKHSGPARCVAERWTEHDESRLSVSRKLQKE